jgi:hypothetical protein
LYPCIHFRVFAKISSSAFSIGEGQRHLGWSGERYINFT